eukprot:1345344-Amorphochlora_amoeboformis.AAC.1
MYGYYNYMGTPTARVLQIDGVPRGSLGGGTVMTWRDVTRKPCYYRVLQVTTRYHRMSQSPAISNDHSDL